MFLSKKINYDKTNYIANSSFFKYYYDKKYFGMGIQTIFTSILILMTLTAYIGYILTNHMNYGISNSNYGDVSEYYLVSIFIYVIIICSFIYGGLYMYWYNYSMAEDSKIDEKEKKLRILLVENLDYELLYDYFVQATKPNQIANISYSLENYAINPAPDYFKNPENVFKYCFTYYILNDRKDQKFVYIKRAIFDIINEKRSELIDIDSANPFINKDDNILKIRKELLEAQDFYIIAKYNHNNNIVLKPLEIIIGDLISNLNSESSANNRNDLVEIKKQMKVYTDANIKAMINKYDEVQAMFMDTIKAYKEIYDKYYMYYMYSVLLTNFLIVYAVLMLVYIILKILCNQSKYFEDNYNIYYLLYYLNNLGIYILLLYFFITCPIIIFGFS